MRRIPAVVSSLLMLMGTGCLMKKGPSAKPRDVATGWVQIKSAAAGFSETKIKLVGVPSADIQAKYPELESKFMCKIPAGTRLELHQPPLWITDPTHNGNLLVIPKDPIPNCAVDFAVGGYLWKDHVDDWSANLQRAAPEGQSATISINHDSWFKHGTADSSLLPEDPSYRCALKAGQSFALKAAPVLVGNLYFVDMTEGVAGCMFTRGFVFKGHLDGALGNGGVGTNPGPGTGPGTGAVDVGPITQEAIDYFREIALGSEFGGGGTIRKWHENLRIKVVGSPNQTDRAVLSQVMGELNAIIGHAVRLELVSSGENYKITFAPESEFASLERNYVARNLGFFWTWFGNTGINRAHTLISTTGVTQEERNHLLREELTQSLGLMNDSHQYQDSIFQQRWTRVQEFAPIDRVLIKILYRPDIRHGMSWTEVRRVLRPE